MNYKVDVIKFMHKIYRNDPFIQGFIFAGQVLFDDIDVIIERLTNLLHFNRLDDKGCQWWERLLTITDISSELSERQARIRAKWRTTNHIDINKIQLVCDSIAENNFKADFVDGKLQIILINENGITTNLNRLIKEIDEIKPAHLPYLFLYMLTGDGNIYSGIGAVECQYCAYDCTNSL